MTRVHLSIPAHELSASVAFYTALFGEGPDKTRPGFARFAPAGVPISLSVVQAPGAVQVPADGSHFGLRTDAAGVAAATARLQAAQLVDRVETAEQCCHATQDKVWAQDPDGRQWEVYTILDDAPAASEADPLVAAQRLAASTGCCAPSPASSPPCCG
jgi:catechol 2,3-dioxygenase-like lactoylglutathione lyase family enzyme